MAGGFLLCMCALYVCFVLFFFSRDGLEENRGELLCEEQGTPPACTVAGGWTQHLLASDPLF